MANRIKGLTVEIDALFTAGCTWVVPWQIPILSSKCS